MLVDIWACHCLLLFLSTLSSLPTVNTSVRSIPEDTRTLFLFTMSTQNSTLLRSGYQLLRTSRSQPAWIPFRQTMPSMSADASRSRFLTTINTSTTASASTSDQHNNNMATGSFTDPNSPVASTPLQDAFKHHDILQEAKKRWGFGLPKSTSSEPMVGVIYPQGRAEIVDLTQRMVQDRVLGGHSGQRQAQEKHSNDTSVTTKAGSTSSQLNMTPGTVTSSSPNPHLHKAPRDADGMTIEVPLWKKHREAIKAKTAGQAWNPQRKLTRQAMEEVRYLRKQVHFSPVAIVCSRMQCGMMEVLF